MANPAREPATGEEPVARPQRPSASLPRWVKVFAVVAVVVALLLLILMAIVGGDHGPARHLSLGDAVGPSLVAGTGAAGSMSQQW